MSLTEFSVLSMTTDTTKQLTTATNDGLSAFERLPLEIRQMVYKYLLKAEYVRQPYFLPLRKWYFFHIAILSCNRKLHRETWEVLYNWNHFVVLSCPADWTFDLLNWSIILTYACENSRLVSKFKKHVLSLHFENSYKNLGVRRKKRIKNTTRLLLLLSHDIPSLVRRLQSSELMGNSRNEGPIHDYSNYIFYPNDSIFGPLAEISYKLKFGIKSPSGRHTSMGTQKAVLEPFRCLKAPCNEVKIHGKIEPAYANGLLRAMMPTVDWTRVRAWRFYDFLTELKDSGDEVFRLGYWKVAILKYGACLALLQQAERSGALTSDLAMRTRCGEMDRICYVNKILSLISRCLSPRDFNDQLHIFGQNDYSPLEKQKFLHYRAMGLSQINKYHEALMFLNIAKDLGFPYRALEEDRAMIDRYLSSPSKSTLVPPQLAFRNLFDEPLTLRTTARISSNSIASERYLLKRLGYEGDLLEHIEESAPANVEAMEMLALQVENQMAHAPDGQAWGLSVNMIGPTTEWRRLIMGRRRIIIYSQ